MRIGRRRVDDLPPRLRIGGIGPTVGAAEFLGWSGAALSRGDAEHQSGGMVFGLACATIRAGDLRSTDPLTLAIIELARDLSHSTWSDDPQTQAIVKALGAMKTRMAEVFP